MWSEPAGSRPIAVPSPQPATDQAVTPREAETEEITVSAFRYADGLAAGPRSITILDQGVLRDTGVERLDEIQGLVPNLQFLTGRSNQEAAVFIRGVGALPRLYFDPGVAVYVDGVPLSRAFGQLIDLLDIADVEVLRGPQGTLFGRNTVAGAINIRTVKPGPEQSAQGLVRAGNRERIDTNAALNAPIPLPWLDDKLFARLSFASGNTKGFTENFLRDEAWSNQNSLAFLGGLRFVPSDLVDITVQGAWSRDHNRSRGGRCALVSDAEADLPLPPGFAEQCEASRPFRFEADVAGLSDLESYGSWSTLRWMLPQGGPFLDPEVRLLAGWREQLPATREDLDMTGLPVLALSSGLKDGEAGGTDRARQVTSELQFLGRSFGGRVALVGGVFAFWEEAEENQILQVLPTQDGRALLTQVARNTIDNRSWALFGNGTFDVTEELSLQAGLRYTDERKSLTRELARGPSPVNPSGAPLIDGVRDFSAWTPMATLAIAPPRGAMIDPSLQFLGYFTYARGFKAGGFNGGAQSADIPRQIEPFAPEFLDSLELGVKASALSGRLGVSAAIFQGLYSDLQVQTLAVSSTGTASVVIENAADARTRGLEIELFSAPIDGLSLWADLGILDARYEEFVGESTVTGEPIDRAGQRFPFVPPIQAHAALQYVFSVRFPGWASSLLGVSGLLVPRIDWYYEGEVFHWGPELSAATQPGYNRLDGRLSLEFADGRAELALWGRNLTDEEYFSDVISVGAQLTGSIVRYYQEPAAFGVEISYRM